MFIYIFKLMEHEDKNIKHRKSVKVNKFNNLKQIII